MKKIRKIVLGLITLCVLTACNNMENNVETTVDINQEIGDVMCSGEFLDKTVDDRATVVMEYLRAKADAGTESDDGCTIDGETIEYDKDNGTIIYTDSEDSLNIVDLEPLSSNLSGNSCGDIESDNYIIQDDNENLMGRGIVKTNEMDNKNVDDMDDTDKARILVLYGNKKDKYEANEREIQWFNENCGESIVLDIDDDVTVDDYMQKMSSADIVVIMTHGLYKSVDWKYKSCIYTEDNVTKEKDKKYAEDLKEHRIIKYIGSGLSNKTYLICPEFFYEHYGNSLSGEYVHLGICGGFGKESSSNKKIDDTLAQELLKCGCEAVTGYYNPVFVDYESVLTENIMSFLFSGRITLTEAIDKALDLTGKDDYEYIDKLSESDNVKKKMKKKLNRAKGGEKKGVLEIRGNGDYIINIDNSNVSWDDFLNTEKYKSYIAEYTKDDGTIGKTGDLKYLKYTEYDLDGDGADELIIEADASNDTTDGDYFNYVWTFALEGDDIILVQSQYGYGNMRYSNKYNAVVGVPSVKPNQNMSYWPFFKFENNSYSTQFIISREAGKEYKKTDGIVEDITGQFDEYMESCSDFDWIDLKTDGESEKSSDEQVSDTETEMVSEETDTETEAVSEETDTETEAVSEETDAETGDGEENLVDGYWTYYGQQSWLIKFETNGVAHAYNMLQVYEGVNGGIDISDYNGDDIEYEYDGDVLKLTDNGDSGILHGRSVELNKYARDNVVGNTSEKKIGVGNIYFFEENYDTSDPMAEAMVIGKSDTMDTLVQMTLEWIENH